MRNGNIVKKYGESVFYYDRQYYDRQYYDYYDRQYYDWQYNKRDAYIW